MTNLPYGPRHPARHLEPVPPAPEPDRHSRGRGLGGAGGQTVTAPPPQHLLFVLKEAQRAYEEGDAQTGLTNLCHAVYVAATKGPQGLTEHDLIRELRGVAGFGFGGEAA